VDSLAQPASSPRVLTVRAQLCALTCLHTNYLTDHVMHYASCCQHRCSYQHDVDMTIVRKYTSVFKHLMNVYHKISADSGAFSAEWSLSSLPGPSQLHLHMYNCEQVLQSCILDDKILTFRCSSDVRHPISSKFGFCFDYRFKVTGTKASEFN
jgi:hypothetical protein